MTRAASSTKQTAARTTARKRAANAAKPKVDTVTQLVEIFAERLAERHVTTKSTAAALSIVERDNVLGVAAWGGDEDTAWERVVATLADDSDDESDDESEPTERVPLRPLTSDPELLAVLDTITGDTPQAVDYAYKAAFAKLTPEGAIVPPKPIMMILGEHHRRVHESFVTSRARRSSSKSNGERKPKGEFQPFIMAVLDWMQAHFAEHGATQGLRVKEIAEGMGKHPGTTWHAVKILTAAHRLRSMPDDAKRFTFLPPAQPDDDEQAAAMTAASTKS